VPASPRSPALEANVLVIGGGITGISLATLLARNGKSTLLIEKHDFASGTSQASGMMIWGGLLYLRNLEFRTVAKFCRARDRLLHQPGARISPRAFTYLVAKHGGRSSWLMWAALQLYRALSGGKRAAVRRFPLERLPLELDPSLYATGWSYEEGFLTDSDSIFTLGQMTHCAGPLTALNYQAITEIQRLADGQYQVTFHDTQTSAEQVWIVDKIVNCGGVWADEINRQFGVRTRHHHHGSKGVYLLLPSTGDDALVMDSGADGDVLCWVPWGEVTLWGPTETSIDDLSDAHATAEDVDWLLDQLNRRSTRTWTRADIVNVRCGVRPLAKLPETPVNHPLDLSRRAIIEASPSQSWWTVFGGKLSGAGEVARDTYHALFGEQPSRRDPAKPPPPQPQIREFFEGRNIPDPTYCREREACRTLEDYLRRRSNIAQWIPRGGFGRNDEFAADLLAIATQLMGDSTAAESALNHYRERIDHDERRWKS
jgi:glycerol-3-phosphate dehydrogenase